MSYHGGKRMGSGRPAGSLNKSSIDQAQRLSNLAKVHSEDAIATLLDVARNGRTDAARVSAANALLDRGYGRPSIQETPEGMGVNPVIITIVKPDERDD
jgi:hypothetical protein